MREAEDFRVAMRRGARSGNTQLVVYLAEPGGNPPEAPALVGFAVSRAVGNAVTRNRVKRRLRHLAAARLTRLAPGARLVVRALPAAAGCTSDQLGEALDDAWHRAARRAARPAGGRSIGSEARA